MSEIEYAGQVAIVTGAGSGIGRATARLLAERGAAVLVNDAAVELAASVAMEIQAAGGRALAESSAIGDHEAAKAVARAALSAFGRIDVLVNNAGVSRPGAFGQISDEEVDRVLAVNLTGSFALMRAVWPTMREQGYGRIVNTSSSAALGSGISGPYAASKAGIIGLTKDAAIAGAPIGIKVNAIMPTASTRLLDNHPDPAFRDWMANHMPVERVAAVTGYLASRETCLNGEILTASGGRVSRMMVFESRGIVDVDLTPETVSRRIVEILDPTESEIRNFQSDHLTACSEAFPE